MSIEIKCDRCGKLIEREDDGTYASRVSNNNFEILRDGKLELHDLCDDCLWKLDIFMTGRMPEPDYKPDEFAYLELPNPKVCVYEEKLLAGRGSEIHISANLEPLSELIREYGVAYTTLSSVKQVILGVKVE